MNEKSRLKAVMEIILNCYLFYDCMNFTDKLEFHYYFEGGMCYINGKLYAENLIGSWDAQLFINVSREFLKRNRKSIYDYLFHKGAIAPRIEWLQKQIERLESDILAESININA